jgi:hypothetical protein
MAKRKTDWQPYWPYLLGGAVVVVVVVVALMQNIPAPSTGEAYGSVMENAQDAAAYRAAEKAAEMDVAQHAEMADYHADAASSASTVSGAVEHGAKAVGEKVQEGAASVREGYNATMADVNNAQMEKAISQTLPASSTEVQ